MANTNAQAINFCNTKVRPMADQLISCYLSAKKIVAIWNAQGLSGVIANDSTFLADGAAQDGRPLITNAMATNIVTRCQEFISWMENGLVASPFNVGQTNATLNTVAQVHVNGQTLF